MLVDDVTIRVSAGNGGAGAVAFNKNLMSLGPAGGSGGNGGNVIFKGTSDLSALSKFRFKKDLKAEDGQNGRGQFRDGPKGKDLVLTVPVGTIIHNMDTGNDLEVVKVGEEILAAHGGHGGKGNFLFRSSTNISPKKAQRGLPGESFTLRLELKFIADVGLVGLPNAGKSSLLNALTQSKSKVGNYAFTTLEPNLGVYYGGLIMADIPGLIEGASAGKGLGMKFLRHIERTGTIFHLISAESEDPARDYLVIRKELGSYKKELLDKKEHVFLTKTDLLSPEEIKKKLAKIKKHSPAPISVYDDESLAKVKNVLNGIEKERLDAAIANPD
jgi:GTP-binding protein